MKTKKQSVQTPFHGRWRITWMEKWSQGTVDAEIAAFIQLGPQRFGTFQFCYVRGDIEFEESTRDGEPIIEFSWNGSDDADRARGRGWAVLHGDHIEGKIYIHRGEWSEFRAEKQQ
jgi:hypothetical protein